MLLLKSHLIFFLKAFHINMLIRVEISEALFYLLSELKKSYM